MRIAAVVVGTRYRSSLGDIDGLATSIGRFGLLHPVVVTEDGRLVAGERRLAAVAKLGWTEVPVTVVSLDPDEALSAERDENEVRKDLTMTEKVAIARAIADQERPKALERKREGWKQRGDEPAENFTAGPREGIAGIAAKAVGISRPTFSRANAVVAAAEADPERFGDLAEQMDTSGKVLPIYNELRRRQDAAPEEPPPKRPDIPMLRPRPAAPVAELCRRSVETIAAQCEIALKLDWAQVRGNNDYLVSLQKSYWVVGQIVKQVK